MFYLIGSGLKAEHLSLEAINALKECDKVYLECYTSKSMSTQREIEKLIKKKVEVLERKQVEEEFNEKLKKAKNKKIALLVIGNPLIATTHIQLLLDARKQKVRCKVIAGLSIKDFIGLSGLSDYKFGKTTSIVFWQENYKPESFYEVIKENYENNAHTLCLLDIQKTKEKEKLMTVKEALELLERIAKKRKEDWLLKTKIIVLSCIGNKNQRIASGFLDKLKKEDFGVPSSLIISGKLNEKEKECLEELTEEIKWENEQNKRKNKKAKPWTKT